MKHKIVSVYDTRYGALDGKGEGTMADDALPQILQSIQATVVALDRKLEALDHKVTTLDHKVTTLTTQYTILSQDIRMIRAAIHDMAETRVTEGEIVALHEDVNRVQQGLADLTARVDLLESRRN